MVGINAGKEFIQNKKAMKNAVEEVTEQAAKDLNVAKNIMDFKVGDSSVGITRITNPNSLTASQIKDFAHLDGISYRNQIRKIDNLTDKDIQNTTSIVSGKLSQQFDDVDMQRQYQNSFYKGIEDALANEAKYK